MQSQLSHLEDAKAKVTTTEVPLMTTIIQQCHCHYCGNHRGKNYPWLEQEPEAQKPQISVGALERSALNFPGTANRKDISARHTNSLYKGPGACSSVCPQSLKGINPETKSIQFSGEMRPRDIKQPTPKHTARKRWRRDLTLHITTFMKVNPQLYPKGYWLAWRAARDVTADRILQHRGILRCQTVPTVPRTRAMQGEAEAQAASTTQDLRAGAGELREQEAGTGLAHQDLIWSLNPEVGQERGSRQGRASENSGCSRNPWPQCELDSGGVRR